MLQLEQNTYYNVIVCGPADNPTLLVNEIDISYPQAGNVALQALHSIMMDREMLIILCG